MKQRIHVLILAVLVTGLLGWVLLFAPGCSAVSHTFGLATTEDVRAERDDQAAIDKKVADVEKRAHVFIVKAIADVLEGKTTVADMVNAVLAYLGHDELTPVFDAGVARTYQRTEPQPIQPPPGTPPWVAVTLGLIGLAGTALGVKAHADARANAQQITETKRSLQDTDDWVHEVDTKKVDKA